MLKERYVAHDILGTGTVTFVQPL